MNAQNPKFKNNQSEVLPGLFAQDLEGNARIEKIDVGGTSYWIKRLHIDDTTITKRIHNFASHFIKNSFLSSTPLVSAEEVTKREIRKYKQFAKAGIPVPEIIWSNETILLLQDASPTVADLMLEEKNRGNLEKVDEYLRLFGSGLSKAHKAGLCHGRPHTRDSVLIDGKLGFIDFEEEPEVSMSIEKAQARDFWLSMWHICESASDENTPKIIFDNWRGSVSDETFQALKIFNKFFMPISNLLRKIPEKRWGSDLRRGILATSFIDKAIAETNK